MTLVEVLIVLVIIGILAAAAAPAYSRRVAQSRQVDAQHQLMVVAQAQEVYRFQNGSYATNAQKTSLAPYGWHDTLNSYAFDITSAGNTAFTARAQGNIDGDATVDTWTVDQNGTLTNTVNDVTN
jgi:prepilin-type N-terminal cleavage/methylation domain-containing protein